MAIVDARIERPFKLSARMRVSVRLDLYNLLNANPEDFIAWGSGTSYLRPSSGIPPRIVRFGVKIDF